MVYGPLFARLRRLLAGSERSEPMLAVLPPAIPDELQESIESPLLCALSRDGRVPAAVILYAKAFPRPHQNPRSAFSCFRRTFLGPSERQDEPPFRQVSAHRNSWSLIASVMTARLAACRFISIGHIVNQRAKSLVILRVPD